MESAEDFAFECILQPSILDERLLNKSPKDPEVIDWAIKVLKELLGQLSAVTKSHVTANGEGQYRSKDHGSLKKKAYIQLMVLRIAAFLSWDISELSDSPALQLLLLETYITVIDTEDVIIERHEDGRPIYEGMNTPVKQFAFILFHRWVLRSLPLLNYPMPPGNKAQIFNNSSSNYFCLIDPETAVTLNAQSTGAFESMQGYYENEEKEFHDFLDTMPSKDSFRIGTSYEKEFLPECKEENWVSLKKGTGLAKILYDFAGYMIFIEDYAKCRNCLQRLKQIDKSVVESVTDKDVLAAYEISIMKSPTNSLREKLFKDKDVRDKPLYQKINEELSCKYKGQQKNYEELLVENVPLRLENGLPFPQSDESFKKADFQNFEPFIEYLSGAKTVNYGKPPNFSVKVDRSKKPPTDVRKRDLLLALMREKRPDKILKIIKDLQNMSVDIRRAVARWHLEDMSIVQAAGRSIDSDYVFILLVKVQQLTDMKAFEDAMDLLMAVERVFNDKPIRDFDKNKVTNYLQMQKVMLKMTEYQETKGQNMEDKDLEELTKDVKDCFTKLTNTPASDLSNVFEMVVVTLLNLDQFEFILQKNHITWNLIKLACLISSGVMNFHKKFHKNSPDFKDNCKALAAIVLPVLQQAGTKRSSSREMSLKENQEKQWIKRLLKRLHSPQVLSFLCAFLVTYYNSINEDTTLEIQCELPLSPLTVNSSISINEDSLLSFILMLAKNSSNPSLSWALRIQGEVHFAQGNYLAAMQHYIKSLIVSTQFFQRPWSPMQSITESWDERMFIKMIKCTSELGHHAESMILCQYQSEVDYVTAFKALEERNGFDAMDSLYPFLWDVTILEYAVSMHNKKGEISRKKKALETISQLEINTNNNEEILREAQAARRSAFLRYMSANYLK